MTTCVLIGRNERIIPSTWLYKIPEINSGIGSMDQKDGISYDTKHGITEETYAPSTTSITHINEPTAELECGTSDKHHMTEKGCIGDTCDDSESDEVFEPGTIARVQGDFASNEMQLNTHDGPSACTFLKERSTSIEETYPSLEETFTSIEETDTSLKETYASLGETASDCSEQTTPEIRMKELKEFSYRNHENDSSSSHEGDASCEVHADRVTTEKRVRLMKSYAWIKEEMEQSTAKYIASHLYQHQPMLLSMNDLECIQEAPTRRNSVEALLKRVLMGPNDIYDVFINVLRQGESKHIAEELDTVEVTDVDIEVFSMLELSAQHKKPRPYCKEPRLTFTKPNQSTLKYWLNDKAVVDSINDQFLSRMIFRIDEHTNIADKTMDTKRKVCKLIHTMKVCSEKILEDFFQILKSDTVCMPHVIEKLLERKEFGEVICRQKEKRKPTSTVDDALDVIPPKIQRKRQTLGQEKQSNIVRTIQELNSNVREKALEYGMVFSSACEGSIIIQLTPKDSNSWRILKTSCRSGKIKDFIPEVFKNNKSDMEEGEYMLRFKIYLLPTPPYSQADKKVMFSLEDEPSTSTYIEENASVLCQELEITDKLLTLLKKEKIVGENIKQDIAKQPRRKKIRCLLDKITQHGDRGYKILKEYTRQENPYLYKALKTKENTKRVCKSMQTGANVTARPGSATKENRKEIFFTASVLLLVKKSEEEKGKDEERDDVEITCPSIVSSEFYFTDEDSVLQDDSDEKFLSLEENWSFETKHQANKEFPDEFGGKRKEIEDFNSFKGDVEPVVERVDDDVSKDIETKVELALPVLSAGKSSSSRKEEPTIQTEIDVKKKISKKTK
ncbi:uncharacterized protein LOC123546602 isoform X2 [Mercenaria mercenaria]|uniref:uncharacterized protein LOC123546602 isoform X2 n=1 Tax=Mercenaria mercenaria TaxID=6596 RepID=UPI00234F65E1|nr:uncharacterized protein LOC123546602 isoform X2 [Mercenaria mercenaria]